MEEKAARYTLDDIVSAATYWETVDNKRFRGPERKLMLAVLKVAIWDFTGHYQMRDARFREARDWLFDSDNDGIFAFESVCEVLRLSAGKIRNGLLDWVKRNHNRRLEFTEVPVCNTSKGFTQTPRRLNYFSMISGS
jgi:hypothetical protein